MDATFVTLTIGGSAARQVPVGTRPLDVLPREVGGSVVVAAMVNCRLVGLATPLTRDADLVPVPLSHWEGERVLRRSLGLLLLHAAGRIGISVRLGASIGIGQRVLVDGVSGSLVAVAERLRVAMREAAAQPVVLGIESWPTEDAAAFFQQRGDVGAAQTIALGRGDTVPLVACGEARALAFGPVVPDASWLREFSLAAGDGVLHLFFREAAPTARAPTAVLLAYAPPKRATDMSDAHEQWLRSLDITSVGALAQRCIGGGVSELIEVSEGFHEKRVCDIAREIAGREGTRAISISGPSSSGKTTFLKRLRVQLAVLGVRAHLISLDDYYVDRERTVRDEHGQLDFEAFEAIDVPLLHGHVAQLLEGRRVPTARYDFASGRSDRTGGPVIELGANDVLMLEGIHGLNPRLLAGLLDEAALFRIFVNPATSLAIDRLTTVSTSDLRLLRRIVRDRFQRAIVPAENIARWPAVRLGERRHIFPHLSLADAVFDTSLIYEPAVLKVYAERYLLEVPRTHPSHATAHRLRGLLDSFVAIYPDHVPPTSLLREFIGGA
jgi:uridine kinase